MMGKFLSSPFTNTKHTSLSEALKTITNKLKLSLVKIVSHCLLTAFVYTLNLVPGQFEYATVKSTQTLSPILSSIYPWIDIWLDRKIAYM